MITRLFLMRPGTPGYDGNGKWWEITFPQAGDSERWHEVRWGAGLRSVGGSKRRFRYGSMHEARRHATRKISEKMGK